MTDEELYEKIDSEVREFINKNAADGFKIWRGLLVDLQAVMETVIPYDIRYGGLPSFYEAGVKSGEKLGIWLMEQFNLKDKSIKERTIYLDSLLVRIEIGNPEFIRGEGEENKLRFNGGTMFAKDYKKTGRNVCYHGAGVTAGVTSVISDGRKFSVKETNCVAAGDPYCEFVIKPSDE
ncbi:MAG: 4-vinyl reductase [Halobacteriota archaeon]|nr:4-vinyl reductase [Halobacteriota archaeon]